jgi:hypothetical protein
MAVTSGTILSVTTEKAPDQRDPLGRSVVFFTVSGTYAQANNSQLLAVATLIQNSRRNGKTLTMQALSVRQLARKQGAEDVLLGIKTLAISTNDITFEITLGGGSNAVDLSTEFTDATPLPTQGTPFGVEVLWTEA